MRRSNYMKKNNYDLVREKLNGEKKALLKDVKPEQEVDFSGDEVDAIQAKILLELNRQLSIRSYNKVMQIDDAIKRLDKETYGFCEECEEQIAQERLELNPYFLTCVSCAEEREREDERRIKNY